MDIRRLDEDPHETQPNANVTELTSASRPRSSAALRDNNRSRRPGIAEGLKDQRQSRRILMLARES